MRLFVPPRIEAVAMEWRRCNGLARYAHQKQMLCSVNMKSRSERRKNKSPSYLVNTIYMLVRAEHTLFAPSDALTVSTICSSIDSRASSHFEEMMHTMTNADKTAISNKRNGHSIALPIVQCLFCFACFMCAICGNISSKPIDTPVQAGEKKARILQEIRVFT